jgi:hypothetical protein
MVVVPLRLQRVVVVARSSVEENPKVVHMLGEVTGRYSSGLSPSG